MSPDLAVPAAPPRADPAAVEDLRDRLRRLRRVPGVGLDGAFGVPPAVLDPLLEHWRDTFDWSAQEERIAALPWEVTRHAAVPVRAVVSRAAADAPVVVLLHGWPDSVLRFERLLPLLGDVTAVAPALPGFPFAVPSPDGPLTPGAAADAVAAALRELGFDRYVVSAGDVGSDVAEELVARHPDAVAALHLTDVSQHHYRFDPPADLDDEERAYVARGHRWLEAEGAYLHLQSTRPDTLAVALGDSPAGLAAWVVEKLLRWTDGDGSLLDVFSPDEALTWVTAYWMTGTIGTSFVPYAAAGPVDRPRVEVPTVFTVFPRDLVNAPRRFAERFFAVAAWRELERGGHFAAWERPEDYAWGVRTAVANAG